MVDNNNIMEFLRSYIITNFILLCIGAVMLFLAIHGYKQHRKKSIFIIAVTLVAFFLSIDEIAQDYTKSINDITATTVLAFLGYIFRPVCMVLLIGISSGEPKGKKWLALFLAPLLINLVIYLLAFIPGPNDYVFKFMGNDSGGISFFGGPLRFSAHVVSAIYLIYFIYVSITRMKMRHIANAMIILICTTVVVSVVVLETFFDSDGSVHLLNTAIMVSVLFYYLFLYIESVRYDPLTRLFNRATYYQDIVKMSKRTTAIIQFDMNGLKYINDNFGHQEGDKGLATIASAIINRCNRHMYAYRLGGDEFTVIVNSLNEDVIIKIINRIQDDLSKTKYSCSVGYAYRKDKNTTIDELVKEADKAMYVAKAEFYKTSKIERRRTDNE